LVADHIKQSPLFAWNIISGCSESHIGYIDLTSQLPGMKFLNGELNNCTVDMDQSFIKIRPYPYRSINFKTLHGIHLNIYLKKNSDTVEHRPCSQLCKGKDKFR
jgi:hypothetical protein